MFLIDLRSYFSYLKPIGIRLIFFNSFSKEREFLSYSILVSYKLLTGKLNYEAGV